MDEATQQPKNRRKWTKILRWVGSAASLALFIWLLARQDWGRVLAHLERIPLYVILAVFALYVCGQVLNAVRWHVLLRAQAVPIGLWDATRIVFAGAFASNFLPSTIGGDAFRFLALFHFCADRALCAGSVLMDRIMNVAAMVTMMPLALVTFGGQLSALVKGRAESSLALVSGWGWFNRLWRKFFSGLEQAFRLWARQPLVLLRVFVISWFSIFVVMIGVWILARGLAIPVALYQVMGVMATTYLLTLLPISINGYGVREVAITALYMHLGATVEQASALAIITRLFMVMETVPGALWMARFLPGDGQPRRI